MRNPTNAEMVVIAWIAGGPWLEAWTPETRRVRPSARNDAIYEAHIAVRRATDLAADNLLASGFLPSHPTVRRLREQASDAAADAGRIAVWADALRQAEAAHKEAIALAGVDL